MVIFDSFVAIANVESNGKIKRRRAGRYKYLGVTSLTSGFLLT